MATPRHARARHLPPAAGNRSMASRPRAGEPYPESQMILGYLDLKNRSFHITIKMLR